MKLGRRGFLQVLSVAPLVFAARSAIAAPLLRPIFQKARSLADLEQALRDAGFTNAVAGYNWELDRLWSRVSKVRSDGQEWHSLLRQNGGFPITQDIVDSTVYLHRRVWSRV